VPVVIQVGVVGSPSMTFPMRTNSMPKQEPTKEQVQQHQQREGQKQRTLQQQSDERLKAAAQKLGIKGPRPGGFAEVMADPAYLQTTLERQKQERTEREDAKKQANIKTPHRPADTVPNRVQFAEGMSGAAVPVVEGNPRFRKG
jgi:hypothetical protein